MDKHYVCTGGCKGVSNTPGVCTAPNCSRNGLELKECSCTDHRHWGAFVSRPPRQGSGQALNPQALALGIGITAALASLINGLAVYIFTPEAAPTLTITSVVVDGLAVGVSGLIAGALIAWIYNAFRR